MEMHGSVTSSVWLCFPRRRVTGTEQVSDVPTVPKLFNPLRPTLGIFRPISARSLLYLPLMRSTRSSTRSAVQTGVERDDTTVDATPASLTGRSSSSKKRSAKDVSDDTPSIGALLPKVKRARTTTTKPRQPKPALSEEDDVFPSAPGQPIILDEDATVIPAKLSFSFEDAKTHLIGADNRFQEMFATIQCKPFEALEPLDPFK